LDTEFVQVPSDEPGHLIRGTLADQQVVDLVAGLGCSTRRPDLIIAEIGMPDHALHTFGYDSPEAEWSVRLADAQIGTLMMRLREHAVPTNLVILSDHGHMDMQHAINVTALTDLPHSCEGQTILIGNTDPAAMIRVDHALRELHCERWPDHRCPRVGAPLRCARGLQLRELCRFIRDCGLPKRVIDPRAASGSPARSSAVFTCGTGYSNRPNQCVPARPSHSDNRAPTGD
jgi:hypothetical protein